MAALIISRNAIDSSCFAGKFPGLRLVEKLEELRLFSLVDVPSYFYMKRISGRIRILALYVRGAIDLIRRRNEEIFFYNFSPAYVGLYFVALLCGLRRPSLFLADGLNCFGMRYSPSLFLRLFRRVISLPMNEVIRTKLAGSPDFIWYPGCAELIGECPGQPHCPGAKVKLLFNSSFLSHNSPELALTLATKHDWLEILVTDNESSLRRYINSNKGEANPRIPDNLKFLGSLHFADYVKVVKEIDGILLYRNEAVFENEYNFPSKFIEALQLNVPVFTMFPITSISPLLYCVIDRSANLESEIRSYIARFGQGEFVAEKQNFMSMCDANRLARWLNADS